MIKNGFFVSQGYSKLIVLFSALIAMVYAFLAKKHRFKYRSAESIHLTLSTFAIRLFITGFVPLFATLDVRSNNKELEFFEHLFRGLYYDFNAEWF